jgi:hypothetical protein
VQVMHGTQRIRSARLLSCAVSKTRRRAWLPGRCSHSATRTSSTREDPSPLVGAQGTQVGASLTGRTVRSSLVGDVPLCGVDPGENG